MGVKPTPWIKEFTHKLSKPEGYAHGFYAPFDRDVRAWHEEIIPWVYERFGPPTTDVWFIKSDILWFGDANCAMEFKLRWA